MTTHLDVLKLELAISPTNLLTNHSGQLGRDGATPQDSWRRRTTPNDFDPTITVDTGLAYGHQGTSLRRTFDSVNGSLKSPRAPAAAGLYANATFAVRLLSTGTYTGRVFAVISIQAYNSLGGPILNIDLQQEVPLVVSEERLVIGVKPFLLPEGTTSIDTTLNVWAPDNDFGNDIVFAAWEAVLVTDAESAVVATPQFIEETLDITGPVLNLSVRRGLTRQGVTDDLEPGELTGTIRDLAGDITPEVNRYTRPGSPVALRVLAAGTWRDLARAHIIKGAATRAGTKATPTTNVTLTATDAVAALANTPKPLAIDGTLEQRLAYLLEGTNRRGRTHQAIPSPPAAPVAITKAESIAALEQLTRLRDTIHGYAWVDASNVVRLLDADHAPDPTPAFTFTDQPNPPPSRPAYTYTELEDPLSYRDIDLDFGTDALVNTLTLTRVNLDEVTAADDTTGAEADDTGAKEYGPYTAQDSVSEWGTFADEVTVLDGIPIDHATYFLSDQTQPRTTVRSLALTIDVDNPAHLEVALADLYTCVRVLHGDHDGLYRIIDVDHTITATRWDLTLTMRPLEVPTSVDLGTPAAGPNTGPGDLNPPTAPTLTTHIERHRTTNLPLAAATITDVAFDAFDVTDADLIYDVVNRWFTATRAGLYAVNACLLYAAGTGTRQARIHVNAVAKRVHITADEVAHISATLRLVAGDKLAIAAWSSDGLTVIGSPAATAVDITRIGP